MSDDLRVDVTAAPGFEGQSALVQRAAEESLRVLDEAASELSIALVDDDAMQELNATWRGKDRPTDVLAFAQREGDDLGDPDLLGDVVISVPTAERQAAERGHSLEHELRELLVHGILHLLGYDHERSPAEERRMFKRQGEVLAAIELGG
ncbi:MAG: rRNA maturation RNase YbeY [Candidatus Binatia bacterium]|nr:rRNA maturation RNase YbeY [Candidatus Binatia bacterium]